MKVCQTFPSIYQNQFGDYCILSYPNQVLSKEEVFEEINFSDFLKWKIKSLFKIKKTKQ
jgi:hypothetical protein